MENKIVIPLPNGYQLVAEQNTDPAYENELFIGITDGSGVWWQNLAVIRNAYQYDGGEVVWKDNEFDILVYSDENNEDYTHDFTVEIYHGGIIGNRDNKQESGLFTGRFTTNGNAVVTTKAGEDWSIPASDLSPSRLK